MKIIQAAKSIKKMTSEDLENIVLSSNDPSQIYDAVQEAYNRGLIFVFLQVSSNPLFFKDKRILSYTINFLMKMDVTAPHFFTIFKSVLAASKENNEFNQKITSISLKNPLISAIALLDENTPNETINQIINLNKLNIPSMTPSNHPILEEMINLISEQNAYYNDISWDNIQSSLILLLRIVQDSRDVFITKAAGSNLSFSVAKNFIFALKHHGNKEIKSTMETNTSIGVKSALGMSKIIEQGVNEQNIGLVIEILQNSSVEQSRDIWGIIEDSVNNMAALTGGELKESEVEKPLSELVFTHAGKQNKTVVDLLIEKDPSMISVIIDFMVKNNIGYEAKTSSSFSKLIHVGLQNPSTKDKILQLPQEWFKLVMMTPQNRELIKEHFNPQEQKVEESKFDPDLIGSQKGWYKKYSVVSKK